MALLVSSPLDSGDRRYAAPGWFASWHRAQKTERHQTALRGRAPTRSHARTASSFPLSREMLDVAPQKPLRADEPVTQNDELGPRRVTVSNQAGAAGIETRVRFWGGLAAAAPASVSLRSVVGPQQSFPSWRQSMLPPSRTDSFGFDVRFFGHQPGGQSNRAGSDRCRSETARSSLRRRSRRSRSS